MDAHTREGDPKNFNVLDFDAALMVPNTGLTHAALTGVSKQSVSDAERMLSYLVNKFLKDNGYANKANGGLSELERCRKNYAMLNMILDEWMPWYKTCYDFSTIDINKYIYIHFFFLC